MTFEDPRRVLARYGLRPKKAFSQNFLCSPHAVTGIARAVLEEPGAGEPIRHEQPRVVELGPGCGTLTTALLEQGANVLAFERDRDMLDLLRQEFAQAAFEVREGDAAKLRYEGLRQELGEPVRLVGNLPYAITGAILRRLIDDFSHLRCAVVMIQREVAERLVAPPGSSQYGALTVFSHNVFECNNVLRVPRTAFHPPPKVDSSVVSLRPRATPLVPPNTLFYNVVQAAFQGRRKTLRNALRTLPGLDVEHILRALQHADIDPGLRGEVLSVEAFGRLAAAVAAQRSDH